MGFANISPLSLLLILLIVVVLFGGKRLRRIGYDVGAAFKNFQQGLKTQEKKNKIKHKDE